MHNLLNKLYNFGFIAELKFGLCRGLHT